MVGLESPQGWNLFAVCNLSANRDEGVVAA